MSDWFAGWMEGHATPERAESFAVLRERAVGGLNRALVQPPAVLIVAHGALFRALRSAMGAAATMRTRNAAPLWCAPSADDGGAWTIDYAD